MMDLYMVGMWLCHIPTLHHYDIFPPGGNMTGGNMLVGHCHDHDHDNDQSDLEPLDAVQVFSLKFKRATHLEILIIEEMTMKMMKMKMKMMKMKVKVMMKMTATWPALTKAGASICKTCRLRHTGMRRCDQWNQSMSTNKDKLTTGQLCIEKVWVQFSPPQNFWKIKFGIYTFRKYNFTENTLSGNTLSEKEHFVKNTPFKQVRRNAIQVIIK